MYPMIETCDPAEWLTEHDLRLIPEADFISALIALTPHDLTVMAKPAVERESALDHDRAAMAKAGEYNDLAFDSDIEIMAQLDRFDRVLAELG